jgi:hypothetical protein
VKRKRKVYCFRCLTDPHLGRSWKLIIEEAVKTDILKKKKQLREQNMEEAVALQAKASSARLSNIGGLGAVGLPGIQNRRGSSGFNP